MSGDFIERLVAGQLLSRMTELEAELAAERAKIKQLKDAGDVLVSLLSHSHVEPCKPPKNRTLKSWCSECYYIDLWKRARRG